MSRPWMPLYIADYLADTAHLNAAESGAYLHLIMHYWQRGGLPDDDVMLARIAKMTVNEFSNARAMLQQFFYDGWKHRRIERELAESKAAYERRAMAGKQGGKAKSAKFSSNAVAMPEQCQSNAVTMPQLSQPQSHLEDLSNDKSCSKPKRHRTRKSYSDDFEEFWKAYPTDALMSKAEAGKAWEKLSDEDRSAAQSSIPAFRAYCGSHSDYRAVHACRYLTQRRFDGFAKSAETVSAIPLVVVEQHTPEGQAWEAFTRATKGKGVPWTDGRWRFPTKYPPEMRAAE